MSLFDDVLNKTVSAIESQPWASDLRSVTLIRDLNGKVRLVLEFRKDATGQDLLPANWERTSRSTLEQQLASDLGPYWGQRIWVAGQRRDAAYQALDQAIRAGRQPWPEAPTTLSGALAWYRLERLFSKSSWFGRTVAPPWKLEDQGAPAIVSFYSFKGGVGRTTAVAAAALLLARARRRIVVLDLDLEAPGIGALLLGQIAPPDDGIVDYLLETELHGQRPAVLGPYVAVQSSAELIGNGEPIRLLTAGRLNGAYLEKVARLDFEGFVSGGRNPLAELLTHVREEYDPEFILLDVRAGLHDLGGLSLNGFSHLDLLFGLDTEQSWAGLTLVLDTLSAATQRREALFVHAMVTPARFDPDANQRFRGRSYDLFRQHYFGVDDDMPDIADPIAPYGVAVPYQEELLNVDRLESVVDLLTRPDGPYAGLVQVIGAYVQRETL